MERTPDCSTTDFSTDTAPETPWEEANKEKMAETDGIALPDSAFLPAEADPTTAAFELDQFGLTGHLRNSH